MQTNKIRQLGLIDTHAHLDLKDFSKDRQDVIKRAREAGLAHIITVGLGVDSTNKAIDMAREYHFISATAGFHPHDARNLTGDILDKLKTLGQSEHVVGFGEIGLDFFRDHSPRDVQLQCFEDLIDLGAELKLPLIIHDRDAHEQVYSRLHKARQSLSGGVIHCFSGDYELARRYIDMGFHISIPGTITYKKADTLRDLAGKVPLESILLETDCPFLAPVPKRGKRNEPALMLHTAEELARVRGVDLEEVAAVTSANARTLFNLDG